MKGIFVAYCFLNCFKAIKFVLPVNVGQVNTYGAEEHQLQRRTADKRMKSFDITLNCSGPQCKKVSETLDRLANTLSSFIQLKNQIKIEAYYESQCDQYKMCEKKEKYSTGSDSIFDSYSLKNKKGLEIIYPSTLYKQLADSSELKNNGLLQYTDFMLYFNSDVKYWFEGDKNIEPDQSNFLLVAAKELIKGLGLYISIGGYDENGLMFSPGYTVTFARNSKIVENVKYNRYILDSLLVTTSDGKSINSLLDQYIDFKAVNISIPMKDIPAYMKKTPLIEASKKIEKLATTPDSLAIKLPNGKPLILETSVQPYDPYLSLRFISESRYLHTKEALLTSKVFYEEKRLPQGKAENWPTYPFGPLLIETLEYMGYTLTDSYKNSEISSESKEAGNNCSNVKVSYCLLVILVSLCLLS